VSQIAVTYYKPPYPNQDDWRQDLISISKLGIKTIQIEIPWGWVEAEADHYEYADFDRLFTEAENAKLNVICVLKPEMQPAWVTRNFATSLITARNSNYFQENKKPVGIFPGCNPDHPDVWDRMSRFIQSTVKRYKDHSNLKGWVGFDLSQPYPEIKDQTVISGFETFLQDKFKSIDELNKKWNRRYRAFSDVTSIMSFNSSSIEEETFLAYHMERMVRHVKSRLYMIRSVDNTHPIAVFGNRPFLGVLKEEGVLGRLFSSGNDWDLADAAEVFGCTSYPKWAVQSTAQRDVRLRFQHSAARSKQFWVSEYHRPDDALHCPEGCVLDPGVQQRWLWQSIATGAKMISFSNWRDEVTGAGAGFFGLAGQDGLASERLEALEHSIGVINQNEELFNSIEPNHPKVGVIFNQESLLFMQSRGQADQYWRGFYDYCRALSLLGVNYRVIEKFEVDDFRDIEVLFAPRLFVIRDRLEFSLNQYIDKGGTLVTEGQCGAFSEDGSLIVAEERWLSRKCAIREGAAKQTRVHLETVEIEGGTSFLLNHHNMVFPLDSSDDTVIHEIESNGKNHKILLSKKIETGTVYAFGSFLGGMDDDSSKYGLSDFAESIIKSAKIERPEIVYPQRKANGGISMQPCTSGDSKVWFIFCDGQYEDVGIRFPADTFSGGAKELMTGAPVEIQTQKKGEKVQGCRVPLSKYGVAILKAE